MPGFDVATLGDRLQAILAPFLAAAAALATVAPAQAQGPAPRMPLGGATTPPVGYVEFCAARPAECRELSGPAPGVSPLSTFWRQAFRPEQTSALGEPARAGDGAGPALRPTVDLDLLNRVNRSVNAAIAPMSDGRSVDTWSLPLADGARTGDCEDYVLEKRRALLAHGLPAETLSIAVVRTRTGESHAVLVVDTADGEMVLDNRAASISPWTQATYRWVKRQSRVDPAIWVRVGAL